MAQPIDLYVAVAFHNAGGITTLTDHPVTFGEAKEIANSFYASEVARSRVDLHMIAILRYNGLGDNFGAGDAVYKDIPKHQPKLF